MKQAVMIVIGDSLACPRPLISVGLRHTYAYRLAKRFRSSLFVANYAVGDNSSRKAVKSSFTSIYVRHADAEFAAIQLGIVDCAPRLLSTVERVIGAVATRVPVFGGVFKAYVAFKARYRLRLTRMFPSTLVSLKEFRTNYHRLVEAIVSENPIRKVFAVNIAAPGPYLLARSYGIRENILAYNACIASMEAAFPGKLEVIDVYTATSEHPDWIVADDGHHITAEAHAWIAKTLARRMLAANPALERELEAAL